MYLFKYIVEIFANGVCETYWSTGIQPHTIHISIGVPTVVVGSLLPAQLKLATKKTPK